MQINKSDLPDFLVQTFITNATVKNQEQNCNKKIRILIIVFQNIVCCAVKRFIKMYNLLL